MALRIFSRLFGKGRDDDEEEEELLEEEEQQDEPEAPPEEDFTPATLELPSEHAVFRLWELRKAQIGWVPAPQLRLTGPPEQMRVLADSDAAKEVSRLQTAVTTTANQRMTKAVARTEDEPDPDLDAQATVFMTRDMLAAWLFVYPPSNKGRDLDKEMLVQVLKDNNIQYNVDESLLDQLPERDDRYFHLFLVARGDPPVHGKDGNIVDLFARKVEREISVDEFNQVDYSSLNLVQNVKEGEAICHIILPTEGVPGKTVQGNDVPAKNGRAAVVPKGRNTEVSEDGTKLCATRAGHVEFSGRSFQVKPLLEIGSNVDFSVGSINFLGDVHVHGDVCSGFTVRATGNVTIDGVVEASTVEAGGDLVVTKGVLGNNQAVITSHRTIYAKYLENCRVHARENLQTDCIVNCDVYSDGAVSVRSGRGTIIGGWVRAANELSASVVGSRAERATMITLGGQPCEDFEKELLAQELRDLRDEYEKTERQPDSPAKLSRMSTLRMKMSVNKLKLEQFDKEDSAKMMLQPPEEIHDMRMTCGIVYPGTEVRIGMAKLKVKQENRQCTIRLVNGQVCFV